jgi:hypothetical protein
MATRQRVDPADIVFDPYEGLLDDTPSGGVGGVAGSAGAPGDTAHVQAIDALIKAGKSDAEIKAALKGRRP